MALSPPLPPPDGLTLEPTRSAQGAAAGAGWAGLLRLGYLSLPRALSWQDSPTAYAGGSCSLTEGQPQAQGPGAELGPRVGYIHEKKYKRTPPV